MFLLFTLPGVAATRQGDAQGLPIALIGTEPNGAIEEYPERSVGQFYTDLLLIKHAILVGALIGSGSELLATMTESQQERRKMPPDRENMRMCPVPIH
jgi:hypothetical protein